MFLSPQIRLILDVRFSGPPCVRQGHACRLVNGKMVIFGGESCPYPGGNLSGNLLCDTFILDLHRNYKTLKPLGKGLNNYAGRDSLGDYLGDPEYDESSACLGTRFC